MQRCSQRCCQSIGRLLCPVPDRRRSSRNTVPFSMPNHLIQRHVAKSTDTISYSFAVVAVTSKWNSISRIASSLQNQEPAQRFLRTVFVKEEIVTLRVDSRPAGATQ